MCQNSDKMSNDDTVSEYVMEATIMSKKLVAYFSASGRTAKKAKSLAAELGADLFEIKPAVAYTRADLNWMNKNSRSSVEMNNPSSRPELDGSKADIAAYDEIYLGFPIWWYTVPTIVLSFLEGYDWAGKTIYPFATSGGSGFGNAGDVLAKSAPGAEIKPGKMM